MKTKIMSVTKKVIGTIMAMVLIVGIGSVTMLRVNEFGYTPELGLYDTRYSHTVYFQDHEIVGRDYTYTNLSLSEAIYRCF